MGRVLAPHHRSQGSVGRGDPEFKVKLTCLVSSGLARASPQSSDSTNPAYSLSSGETETGGSLAKWIISRFDERQVING